MSEEPRFAVDPERRPRLALLLGGAAGVLILRMLYLYVRARLDGEWPTGHPWLALTHLCNAGAVLALALRWTRPALRGQAMIAALVLAAAAFFFAQRAGSL